MNFSFEIEQPVDGEKKRKCEQDRDSDAVIESVHIKGILNYDTGICIRAWNMESMRLSRHTNNPKRSNQRTLSFFPFRSYSRTATKKKNTFRQCLRTTDICGAIYDKYAYTFAEKATFRAHKAKDYISYTLHLSTHMFRTT